MVWQWSTTTTTIEKKNTKQNQNEIYKKSKFQYWQKKTKKKEWTETGRKIIANKCPEAKFHSHSFHQDNSSFQILAKFWQKNVSIDSNYNFNGCFPGNSFREQFNIFKWFVLLEPGESNISCRLVFYSHCALFFWFSFDFGNWKFHLPNNK